MIVRGVLHVDAESLKVALAKGGYVTIRVDVRETILGAIRAGRSFQAFVRAKGAVTKSYDTAGDEVASWDGLDRIVFLRMGGNYLASTKYAGSIVEPTRAAIIRVRQREMLHRELLSQSLRQDRKLQKPAVRWIKRMTGGKDMQLEAFDGLEEMGAAATVEIVAAMDNRRVLPETGITLQNKAKDAFEASRHYGVKQAVDAIAAILNQNTGESFGWIYSDSNDVARTACVRGWTIYAHYLVAAREAKRAVK